ncbi:MAG: VanZ family protein [Elusimicrobia bacterium]|nr:VanZ family protein [Elusimicrobiota bacterium]
MPLREESLRRRRWDAAVGFFTFLLVFAWVGRPVTEALRARNLLRLTLAAMAAVGVGWLVSIARRQRAMDWVFWVRLLGWGIVYVVAGRRLLVAPEEQLHLLDMVVLTYLWYQAVKIDVQPRGLALGIAGVLGCLAGAAEENLQRFIPGRYYTLQDVGLNCLSVFLALGVIVTLIDRPPRHKKTLGEPEAWLPQIR